MEKLIINSLALIDYPREIKTLKTNIQYTQLNQILGSYRDICYHLHKGTLYFFGDEDIIATLLRKNGFICHDLDVIALDLLNNWEIIRPIFYKCLRYYFYSRNFLWEPKKRNQVFILNPEEFEGIRLVHQLSNNKGEKLLIYEGFRYWLEFLGNEPVLTLLPKVKPILSFKPKLSIKDILLNPLIFREINPALMRERSFSEPFRKIALKPNWKKLNVLKTIVKLLSNGKKEIIVPAGNIERGLIFDSNLITIEETRADFYGK